MADNNTNATVTVAVNGDAAKQTMTELEAKAESLKQQIDQASKALKPDTKEIKKLQRELKATEKELKANADQSAKYQKVLDNLADSSVNDLEKGIRALRAELKKLKPETDKLKIEEKTKQLKQMEDRLKDVNKTMGKTGTESEKAGNNMKEAFTKAAAKVAIVVAALKKMFEFAQKVASASQTMGDKWANTMKAMKTATDAFFMAASSGNWDAFNDGIDAAIARGEKLAQILDTLGSYKISEGVMQSEYLTDYNEQRTIALDPDSTPEEQKAALDKMEDDINHYKEFVQSKGEETMNGLRQQFEAWKGLTFSSEEEFKSFFIRLYEYTNVGKDEEVEKLKKLKANLDAANQSVANAAPSGNQKFINRYVDAATKAKNAFDAAYNSASKETKALFSAWELNDEKLQESATLFAEYNNSVNAIAQYNRQLNKTKNTVNNKNNGGSGGGGSKTPKREKATVITGLQSNGIEDIWKAYYDGIVNADAEAKKILNSSDEQYFTQLEERSEVWQAKHREYLLSRSSEIADEVNQIAEGAGNFIANIQQAELASLEAQYQADLTAAGDSAEKREEIQANYEAKQLELKKKYADTEMVVNIAKTTASGALAAVKAYAEGGPYLGPVLAAMVAATTAAEIATIIAQRNAIKNTSVSGGGSNAVQGQRELNAYASGGYTPKANTNHMAVGIVDPNEYVSNHAMVNQMPQLYVDLERYRTTGVKSGGLKAYASGGSTGGNIGTNNDAILEQLVPILSNLEQNGVRAYVVYNQLKDVEHMMETKKDLVKR